MTSEIPTKPKTGNNHVFAGLAVAMLLATGGLITWKVTRDSSPEPAVTTAAPEEEAPARNSPPPPPPPADEPAAEPTTPTVASAAPIKSGKSPCSAECTGEGTAALKSALAARGGMSRRCYEKQLSQNASLSGKMTVHLKIAPNGQVCSANIANDTIGDGGLANCVLGIFRSSTFPASPGGCVEVNAPLNFVPKK